MHSRQIIHRDIKPQNVLLQGNTPRLADFGISRVMHHNSSDISSVVIGTDSYMAPEAFDGIRNVQTDIWSVGVILYELLMFKKPFPQKHPTERMFAVLTKDFEPLPEYFPTKLKEITNKALAKKGNERFQTATEIREKLKKVLVYQQHPQIAPTQKLDKAATDEILTEIKTKQGAVEEETAIKKPEFQSFETQVPKPQENSIETRVNKSTATVWKPAQFKSNNTENRPKQIQQKLKFSNDKNVSWLSVLFVGFLAFLTIAGLIWGWAFINSIFG